MRRAWPRILVYAALSATAFQGCAAKAPLSRPAPGARMEATGKEAFDAYMAGELKAAESLYAEQSRLAASVDDRRSETRALVNLGRVRLAMGDYGAATAALEDALESGADAPDSSLASEAHATFAKALMLSGGVSAAWVHMEESARIDAATGERSGARLNLRALMLIDAGRLEEAEAALKDALLLNGGAGREAEAANTERAYALLELRRGNAGEAFTRYARAREMDSSVGDSAKVALDLGAMARLSAEDGRLDEAVKLYERSYRVLVNAARYDDAAATLDRIIWILNARGDSEGAAGYERLKDAIAARAGGGAAR